MGGPKKNVFQLGTFSTSILARMKCRGIVHEISQQSSANRLKSHHFPLTCLAIDQVGWELKSIRAKQTIRQKGIPVPVNFPEQRLSPPVKSCLQHWFHSSLATLEKLSARTVWTMTFPRNEARLTFRSNRGFSFSFIWAWFKHISFLKMYNFVYCQSKDK